MARVSYISPLQFEKADALATALMGGNALKVLLSDQRAAIATDLRKGVGNYSPVIPYMPRKVTAYIDTQRIENFTGDKAKAVLTSMNFGGQVIFDAGKNEQINLRQELIRLKAMLEAASGHSILKRYKTTFAFWVGGKVMSSLPPEGEFAIGGVVNTHSYAPKVECRNWPRAYRKVWLAVNRIAYKRRMDIRIRNLQGITEENEGRPWPSPVIELGYLNTMKGKTGNFLGRQRCNKQSIFPIK